MSIPQDRRMADAELAAIEARATAATEGPWGVTHYSGGVSFQGPARVYAGTNPEYGEPRAVPATDADVAFIAASREDVPALVAEVRRLADILEMLEAHAERVLGAEHLREVIAESVAAYREGRSMYEPAPRAVEDQA